MKFFRILSYFFTDNSRFWLCARFYPSFFLAKVMVETKFGKYVSSKLSREAKIRIATHHAKVIGDTFKFKIEKGDKI